MSFQLTIKEGPGAGKSFSILRARSYTIGRGVSCDVMLFDKEISRAHCEIRATDDGVIISDLGSLNGTVVDGEKIKSKSLLGGEIIKLGLTSLEFTRTDQQPSPGPTPADQESEKVEAAVEAQGKAAADTSHGLDTEPGPRIVHIEEETTIREFLDKHPKDSANKVIRWWQFLWYMSILAAMAVLFLWDWLHFLHILHLLCAAYLIVAAYKLVIVLLSAIKPREIKISDAAVRGLSDHELPVYTILVPLYKEEAVAQKIINAVNSLDYPQQKLDVKVLLEPDDAGTIQALRRAALPDCVQLIVVPHSKPKTKPKACNHGLKRARGEYLVIYDAEDHPDPDQLKKAVVAFETADKRTICLQAKLNYYNPDQNALTRWFTVEYSTWFDLYLPGLHALGAPIPLGGTSNHFKTSVLKEIGGWDPFNVTEDCDLGIRLHKMGYKTQVFDSTTWEEANSRLLNWIRQRSRWVKGYIQTHLVHMRNPLKTLWKLKPWGFSHFLASVGGLSLMLLMNPFFWLMGAVYLGLWTIDLANNDWSIGTVMQLKQTSLENMLNLSPGPGERLSWHMLFWEVPRNATRPEVTIFWNRVSQVFWAMTLVLFASNFFFILTHVLACVRRKTLRLLPYAILSPFYWLLISIGAWKGFLQLFFRPFYWEKTVHGLDAPAEAEAPRLAAEGTE